MKRYCDEDGTIEKTIRKFFRDEVDDVCWNCLANHHTILYIFFNHTAEITVDMLAQLPGILEVASTRITIKASGFSTLMATIEFGD